MNKRNQIEKKKVLCKARIAATRPRGSTGRKALSHVVAVMLPALCPVGVAAQSEAAGSTTLPEVKVRGRADNSAPQLDEVNRAGSRLGLTPRETPASVESISSELMAQRGARTFEEALRGATGVTTGGAPGSPSVVSTRGFTGNANVYLFDGSRITQASMSSRPQDTFNYQSIDILKGPSSVLYGDSALGSTINFITKRPGSGSGIDVLASYGSFNTSRLGVGFGANVAGGEIRADLSRQSSDGFIDRNTQKLWNLTLGAAFNLSSRLKLEVSFDVLKDKQLSYWGTPLISAANAQNPTGIVTDLAGGRVIDRRLLKTNFNVNDGEMTNDSYWTRGKLSWAINPQWTLRNELSYYTADRFWRNAEVYTFIAPNLVDRSLVYITHDHNVLTNRTDLAYQGQWGSMKNRFVAGVEYSKTDFGSRRRFSGADPVALRVNLDNPSFGAFIDNDAIYNAAGAVNQQVTADIPTLSFFAENALSVLPNLIVVAGARNDRIKLSRTIADFRLATNTAFERTYNANAYRFGAVWEPAAGFSLYGQYSDAVAPVGTILLLSQANSNFDLTRGKQLEFGLKHSFWGGRADWTLARYEIEQKNILTRDPANPANTIAIGKQSSRGVELSASVRPIQGLTISGNYADLRARFDELIEAGNVSRVGNTPPNVPNRVANLWLDYKFASIPLGAGVGVNSVSDFFTNNANTIRINGYTTADAYLSWAFNKTQHLTFRVRNIGDKEYATWTGAAATQVMLGMPRNYEISFRAAF